MRSIYSAKNLLAATLLASTSMLASPANAGYAVPAGCTAPSTTYVHQWYIDPIYGADTGNGSQAHPWKTLQNVISAGLVGYQGYSFSQPVLQRTVLNPASPQAVVHAGDVIWLASGDHGDINLRNAYNASYITIKALPGAKPTLKSFSVIGGSHWVLDGATVEATNPNAPGTGNNLVTINSNPYWGALNNIVLNGNTIRSQADTTAWLPADWRNKASLGIYLNAGLPLSTGAIDYNGVNDGTCFSITNNAISNVTFGSILTLAHNVLYKNNKIDRFVDDGIDYNSSDLVIDHNTITNSIDDGDGIHRDGMQGQPYWGDATFNKNITFSNNIVIAQTDPHLKYAACMQGIDTFNGHWANISAYNNLIIANTYNGLIFAGVNKLSIVNNTVLASGLPQTCFVQPGAPASTVPESAAPTTDAAIGSGTMWIGALDGLPGNPSVNVTIRNNIANTYNLSAKTSTTFDHNIVAGTNLHPWIPLPPGANVAPTIVNPELLFNDFHPATYSYDVHLISNTPAKGAGVATGAPTVDLYGTARRAPFDDGAIAAATADAAVLGGTLGTTPYVPTKSTP